MKVKKTTVIFDFIIVPFLILLFSFNPFFTYDTLVSIDEGAHLSWINAILHGQIPYRDTYLIYGVIYDLIPAGIMFLVGKSIAVLRAFYQFGALFWLIIAYLFGLLVLKKKAFAYLLAWLLISTRVEPFWISRWGGMRNAIPFLVIVFFYLYTFDKRKRPFLLYLAGLFNGISLLYTQESGIAALLASVMFFVFFKRIGPVYRRGSLFKSAGIFIGGMATMILPIFFYLGINNALGSYFKICFIDIPFKFPKHFVDIYPYVGLLPKTDVFKILSNPQLSRAFLFCMAFILYAVSFIYSGFSIIKGKSRVRRLEAVNILILSVFGFSLLIFAIRQIHGMQFNIAAPPLLIVGCLLWERLFSYMCNIARDKNITAYRRNAVFLANLIFILSASALICYFTKPVVQFKYLYEDIFRYQDKQQGLREKNKALNLDSAKGIRVPAKQAEELEFVCNFIKNNTTKDEPIFVFPHNGEYYFLTDRISASRFTLATFAMISPGYEEETIKDLKAKKPAYIIYVRDAYVLTHFQPIASEKRIPKVFGYILENYIPITNINNTYILKLK